MKTTTAFLHRAAATPETSMMVLSRCRRTDTAEVIRDRTEHPAVKAKAGERITELIDAALFRHYVLDERVPIHE